MLYIHSIIIIIAFILAAIILVFYTSFQKEKNIFEKFANTTLEKDETFSMTFSEFLSKYNIKSKEELKMILSGNYNEDLSYIYNENLTLYYSIFSKDSLILNNYTWKNISPYFVRNVLKECTFRNHMEYTDIILDKKGDIITDKRNGVSVNETVLHGPLSHQLGINSLNFTFVILFNLNTIEKSEENLSFIKLYANTISNNGLSIDIVGSSVRFDVKETYTVNFMVRYSGNIVKVSGDVELNMTHNYILYCTKDKTTIELHAFDLTSMTKTNILIINDIPEIDTNIILSNKNFTINQNSNLHMNIYSLSIFNQSIYDVMYLINYFTIELYKISQEFKTLSSVYLSVETSIEEEPKLSTCIYDKVVCDTCDKINDWNNISELINATKDCKLAISDYCKMNPGSKGCECWASDSAECAITRSIFDGTLTNSNNESACTPSNNEIPNTVLKDTCKEFTDCMKKHNIQFGTIEDFYIEKYNQIAIAEKPININH